MWVVRLLLLSLVVALVVAEPDLKREIRTTKVSYDKFMRQLSRLKTEAFDNCDFKTVTERQKKGDNFLTNLFEGKPETKHCAKAEELIKLHDSKWERESIFSKIDLLRILGQCSPLTLHMWFPIFSHSLCSGNWKTKEECTTRKTEEDSTAKKAEEVD